MLHYLGVLNNNRVFWAITMLIFNLGSRFVLADVTVGREHLLTNALFKRIVVFCMFFVATRDVALSIMLTVAFLVLFNLILRPDVDPWCVIPLSSRCVANKKNKKKRDEEKEEVLHRERTQQQQQQQKQQTQLQQQDKDEKEARERERQQERKEERKDETEPFVPLPPEGKEKNDEEDDEQLLREHDGDNNNGDGPAASNAEAFGAIVSSLAFSTF